MHVTVLTTGVLTALHDATGYVFPCLIEQLKERGHRVSYVPLCLAHEEMSQQEKDKQLQALQPLRVGAYPLNLLSKTPERTWRGRLQQLLHPKLEDLYPTVPWRLQLEPLLASLKPDVIFLFETYEGIMATHGMELAPRFALLGDPPHLPRYYRSQLPEFQRSWSLKQTYHTLLEVHRQAAMRSLLGNLDGGGAVAAHHAAWFKEQGLSGCEYLRNPVPDEAGADWQLKRAATATRGIPKLILVGRARGTATLSGLRQFAQETLPHLEQALGVDGFEAHIIGKDALPEELARRLQHPSVKIRGFVEDLAQEFLSADFFVVPTPR
ncbi:MAG: glycosyltransferase family 4 protein [Candidatus Omnitrophica bacterium]|nr:glycosyltransferase family 4 protein [Candidatus Omnitrophota bacterium]